MFCLSLHSVYLTFLQPNFTIDQVRELIKVGPRFEMAGSKVQVTFHRSRVQVIAPLINYQTTQIPLDLIEHFVKRLGLGDSYNVVHLSLSW